MAEAPVDRRTHGHADFCQVWDVCFANLYLRRFLLQKTKPAIRKRVGKRPDNGKEARGACRIPAC
jgi:hypothetical protein